MEVLTSKAQRVQPEWLNFVTTARARAKIDFYLRREAKAFQKKGEAALADFFDGSGIMLDDAALDKLTHLHGFHTHDELFVAIGNGKVVLGDADRECVS